LQTNTNPQTILLANNVFKLFRNKHL